MAASASTFLLFLLLPHSIGWFGFVDGRVLPVTILTAILTLDTRAARGRFQSIRLAAVEIGATISVALALFASSQFQNEANGASDVLSQVPARSRLLYFPLEPDSSIFTGHPFVHYDKLILIQRPIVPSGLWFHQGTAIYPTRINPTCRSRRFQGEQPQVHRMAALQPRRLGLRPHPHCAGFRASSVPRLSFACDTSRWMVVVADRKPETK
jgi:hypothetical protein